MIMVCCNSSQRKKNQRFVLLLLSMRREWSLRLPKMVEDFGMWNHYQTGSFNNAFEIQRN